MTQENSKIESERQLLINAKEKGTFATLGVYLKLSGPGWLQSALTLGGGSLSSSLYLGVLVGVSMMWLQPVAMILGIVMLSSIGYVAMATGKRPFRAINEHVNPVLGWGWLLASMAANMVWALPQYSLCYGVMSQNLMPDVLGPGGALAGDTGKWVVSGVVLAISIMIVWSYGSGSWGIKLYEWMLKGVVALIVFCFLGVVIRMSFSDGLVDWGAIMAGFVPNLNHLFEPAKDFQPLLASITDTAAREYWTGVLISEQRDVMISAAATAVGINMTFLLPYSMLSRGWDKNFTGLATFDLSTGMFIPFVLATSCVVIASATQFHAKMPAEFVVEKTQVIAGNKSAKPFVEETQVVGKGGLAKSFGEILDKRNEKLQSPLTLAEQKVAAALVRRDAMDLSASLAPLTGDTVANYVFGIGVVGMTLSSISLLMLISGFIVCEVLNVPSTGWTHRIGCLAAASGALWPLIWQGKAAFWLGIVTSLFGMALLPIAYLTFFLLINQKSLLKEHLPTGGKRIVWNVAMVIALGAATVGSGYVIWTKSAAKLGSPWWGVGAVVVFLAITLVVQFTRKPPAEVVD